jgi:hypothetical protein
VGPDRAGRREALSRPRHRRQSGADALSIRG